MLVDVKTPGGYKRRPRRPDPDTPPDLAVRSFAVGLFDKGDGRAVDWAEVAAAAFKAAFACLDEIRGEDRAMKVLRRVQAGAYDRLAGNPDDGTPFTNAVLPKPPVGAGPVPGLDHDLHR